MHVALGECVCITFPLVVQETQVSKLFEYCAPKKKSVILVRRQTISMHHLTVCVRLSQYIYIWLGVDT